MRDRRSGGDYRDGSTGQNCVTVTSSSVDWGVQKPMSDGPGGGWGPGAGFSCYAGPVNGAGAGHCIDACGLIDFGGVLSYAEVKSDC